MVVSKDNSMVALMVGDSVALPAALMAALTAERSDIVMVVVLERTMAQNWLELLWVESLVSMLDKPKAVLLADQKDVMLKVVLWAVLWAVW